MQRFLAALLSLFLLASAASADPASDARAALALASAQTPAAKKSCDCAPCDCPADKCPCPACPCLPGDSCRAVTRYEWKPSTEAGCHCLLADGQWVGCYYASDGSYYRRVGEGGQRDRCPTAPPTLPARVVPTATFPANYFVPAARCAGGSCR